MPPPLPRNSLSSLTRCQSSRALPTPSRAFTTSTRLSSIGPENPKFIEVPTTLQPHAVPVRDIKGKLPPPRNIFPSRGPDKTTAEYIAFVTAEPNSAKKLKEPANERIAWKRRMADIRRINLREGLVELKKRENDQKYFLSKRSAVKRKERAYQLSKPQREDERLTNPTVTAAVKALQIGAVPDPGREQRIAEKKERIAVKETAKEEARKDALHTLYMHARDFITTEEQLNVEIDKIFVPEPFVNFPGKTNIWDTGAPLTVQNMLQGVNNTQKNAVEYHEGPAAKTGRMLKRIGEELTGGKMD